MGWTDNVVMGIEWCWDGEGAATRRFWHEQNLKTQVRMGCQLACQGSQTVLIGWCRHAMTDTALAAAWRGLVSWIRFDLA